MTDDGDLRARLARRDPARGADATARLDAITADEIRERAMHTMQSEDVVTTPEPRRWRRPALVLGAAASVAAIALAVTLANGGSSSPAPRGGDQKTLALRAPVPAGGPAAHSCLQFDVAILRDMPTAFGGTVTAIADGTVTLDVDRWFTGGDADVVTITTATNTSVALDGVDFAVGSRYLITASNGEVNTCGYSGPATPDLEKSFVEAFAS